MLKSFVLWEPVIPGADMEPSTKATLGGKVIVSNSNTKVQIPPIVGLNKSIKRCSVHNSTIL